MQSGLGFAGIVAVPIPPGGAPGEVLTKLTAENYDTYWATGGGTGGGSTDAALAGAALMYLCDPDSDDAHPMPGERGPAGANGSPGVQGPTGPALFFLQDDEADLPPPIPGPRGDAGVAGATGRQGDPLFFLRDEPEDHISIPGPQGNIGSQGSPGVQGIAGPALFLLQEDQDDSMLIPGPTGAQGIQGPAGPSGSGGGGTVQIVFADGEEVELPLPLIPADVAFLNKPQTFVAKQIFSGAITLGSPRDSQQAVVGPLARFEMRATSADANGQRFIWLMAQTVSPRSSFALQFQSDDGTSITNVLNIIRNLMVVESITYGNSTDLPLHILNGMLSKPYSPGSFSLTTGRYGMMTARLALTGTQRATLAGTARLRIT